MLSLGCERLPTPLKKKKGSLPTPRSGYATTITVFFFAHLLILQYPDHHQNLISSSLYYSGPVHKISSQSVHNVLSNVVHRQTHKQTDKLTNATKNINLLAKEVTIRTVQLHFSITRTVFKMSDYHVASCISIGFLFVYVVIIVKTITDNEDISLPMLVSGNLQEVFN